MIYLFKVYILAIVLVFGLALMLFLAGAMVMVVLKALRSGTKAILARWRARDRESPSGIGKVSQRRDAC